MFVVILLQLLLIMVIIPSQHTMIDAFRSVHVLGCNHYHRRSLLFQDETTAPVRSSSSSRASRRTERDDGDHGGMMDRRRYLSLSVLGTTPLLLRTSTPARAVTEEGQRMEFTRRPTAPTRTLMPAAQQRILLEQCLILSDQLSSSDTTKTDALVARLRAILVDPRTRGDTADTLRYYTPNLTFRRRFKRDRDLLTAYYDNDRATLSGDIVQAAMNVYTDSLRYGADYTVRDDAWKRAYIRAHDGLPDVERLIRADMDLRELYRNQVQLRVDDAAAELFVSFGGADHRNEEGAAELRRLLRSATASFDQWFDLIDDADVHEVLRAVSEGRSYQFKDYSYASGFVPPSERRR